MDDSKLFTEGLEFDDQDIDDPELLKQLEQLILETPSTLLKNKPKTQTNHEIEPITIDFNKSDQSAVQSAYNLDQSLQNISPLDTQIDSIQDISLETHTDLTDSRLVLSLTEKNELEYLMTEYKRIALEYKKVKAMKEARNMLIISKSISIQLDSPSASFKIPPIPTFIPPPNLTDIKASSSPANQSNNSKLTMNSNQSVINHLLLSPQLLKEKLESQINLCTQISSYYYKQNQTPKSLDFHKLKKRFINDQSHLSTISITTPISINQFTIDYEIETTFPDIDLDVLQIHIIKVWDLDKLLVKPTPISCSIQLGNLGDTQSTLKTINTPIFNSSEMNFKQDIKIQRNKGFLRYIERQKIMITLFSNSSMFFGLFNSPVAISKCSIKLDELYDKCEVFKVFEMFDPLNQRKTVHVKIEIGFRLRVPLNKRDIRNKIEEWVSFDYGNVIETNHSIGIDLIERGTDIKPIEKEIPLNKTTVSEHALKGTPFNETPMNETPLNESPLNELSELIQDYEIYLENPDNIQSNHILETEHAQLLTRLIKTKDETLLQTKLAYELRMQYLVTMVQIGKLSVPDYLNQLIESKKKYKEMALIFKKGNRMDLCKICLCRIKLVDEEIKSF